MATQYTYYPAATKKHPEKAGVNRIMWEDNGSKDEKKWTEVTREYFAVHPDEMPSDFFTAFMNCKESEKKTIANDLKKYL
jgi:hypothetical protein